MATEKERIKFRCSMLGALMTQPRSKADREAGIMSETAKSYIRDTWLKKKYGYDEPIVTDPFVKGTMCEQDSMALYQEYLSLVAQDETEYKKEFLVKNSVNLENEDLTGTPDIIRVPGPDDIKTSWSLKTFFDAAPTKMNEWQIKGYCYLTDKPAGNIVYCLIPTPEEMIQEVVKRYWFKFGCNDENKDFIEIENQIRHNNEVIKTIPLQKRVKRFPFTFTETDKAAIMTQCERARRYYDQITL